MKFSAEKLLSLISLRVRDRKFVQHIDCHLTFLVLSTNLKKHKKESEREMCVRDKNILK